MFPYIPCRRGLSKAKLNEACSRTSITKLPIIQSHFKCTSSISAIVKGFFTSECPRNLLHETLVVNQWSRMRLDKNLIISGN